MFHHRPDTKPHAGCSAWRHLARGLRVPRRLVVPHIIDQPVDSSPPACETSSSLRKYLRVPQPDRMPLPRSLRRHVRPATSTVSTRQSQRRRCRTCNNLDPRDHASSVYDNESVKEPRASLSLVLDALSLSKTKENGCRFCNVLIVVLDAFFEKWRGARIRVNVDIKEKSTIKISLDGERWKDEIAEIYAGSGRRPFPSCIPCSVNTASCIVLSHE